MDGPVGKSGLLSACTMTTFPIAVACSGSILACCACGPFSFSAVETLHRPYPCLRHHLAAEQSQCYSYHCSFGPLSRLPCLCCRAPLVHLPRQQGHARQPQVKQSSRAQDDGRPVSVGTVLQLHIFWGHQLAAGRSLSLLAVHAVCRQCRRNASTYALCCWPDYLCTCMSKSAVESGSSCFGRVCQFRIGKLTWSACWHAHQIVQSSLSAGGSSEHRS